MVSLSSLNACDRDEFTAALGSIFEHAPWVAAAAWDQRPFTTRNGLHTAMMRVVEQAGEARQLEFLRAHPELAGRAALAGEMTDYSKDEQGGSGLLHCSPQELAALQSLNRRYAARFGFPFILAVRGMDRASIIAAFEERLENDRAAEKAEALRQVRRITAMRLDGLLG